MTNYRILKEDIPLIRRRGIAMGARWSAGNTGVLEQNEKDPKSDAFWREYYSDTVQPDVPLTEDPFKPEITQRLKSNSLDGRKELLSRKSYLANEKVAMFGKVSIYPPRWDWRNIRSRNWTTPPKHQMETYACTTFAALAALETYYRVVFREKHYYETVNIDFSEADVFYGLAEANKKGTNSTMQDISDYINKYGIIAESSCPFPRTAKDLEVLRSAEFDKIRGKEREKNLEIDTNMIEFKPIDDWGWAKEWIVINGPVVGTMNPTTDFQSYREGIYSSLQVSDPSKVKHAVCIVGFDDDNGYWICKNSLGPCWGEDGFFRIAYGECGLGADGFWGFETMRSRVITEG